MPKKEIYIICHNIRSLHNVGSFFRTADAAAVTKIYLSGYTGAPPRKEISKVALGAEEFIPWEKVKSTWRLVKKLKKEGIQIVSLEKTKKSIFYTKFKPKFPMALVLGHEIRGIPESVLKRSDKIIHIPMLGKKESLNVSVAFGVAVYELNKSRKIKSAP